MGKCEREQNESLNAVVVKPGMEEKSTPAMLNSVELER